MADAMLGPKFSICSLSCLLIILALCTIAAASIGIESYNQEHNLTMKQENKWKFDYLVVNLVLAGILIFFPIVIAFIYAYSLE